MCGVAGIFCVAGLEETGSSTAEMLEVEAHRGPDSRGIWCGSVCGKNVGLGLNRLKILDLSDVANQPMFSKDDRFALVYNGEIYNYIELRTSLSASGVVFNTEGDTEVVLQALIQWGPDAFARFNGMWALVFLDRKEGKIILSRDRFGIKPLYTYIDEQKLIVASEIKAILTVARKKFQVSLSTANAFLSQSLLCTGEDTFFEGIKEFPPGHWAVGRLRNGCREPLSSRRYWQIPTTDTEKLPEHQLVDLLRGTFIDSVALRLRSDVPVAILLSGGVDSSAIAGAVHHLDPSRTDIKLISAVGNHKNSEEPFIDMMGAYLKRSIEKVHLDYAPSQAFQLIGEASWFNDEPVGSFSTIAHFLLMQRARDLNTTVLLSGQGADEILCGYRKYLGFYIQELIASGRFLKASRILAAFVGRRTLLPQMNYREAKLMYQEAKRYLPRWLCLPQIDIRGQALLDFRGHIPVGLAGGGVISRQVLDIEKLSVPALIHYEDRMSMAVAREIRLPFLDYRLVSLLVPLEVEYKLRDGWTKWIFRRAMETLLPTEIAWRRDKQHFPVPQNTWFRKELRTEMERLLENEWLTEELRLIDRRKLYSRYKAYLAQPTNGPLGIKDIFPSIALELWARRFQTYLVS